MGETVDDWRALREAKRAVRRKFGIDCPTCKRLRPRAFASILLPGDRCNLDGYRDQRPALSQNEILSAQGAA